MTREEYLKLAIKIIKEVQYITLATVTPEGQPWNSPLYTAFDKNYTFYSGTCEYLAACRAG